MGIAPAVFALKLTFMSKLESELQVALLDLHRKWGTIGYRATFFKRMLVCANPKYVHGPVGTVKHLIGKNLTEKSGFERSKGAGRLDWSVEKLIQQEKWRG